MSDLEKAKATVIALIKKGRLSKEQGQKALAVYQNALAKGQKVTIALVLQKMGFIKAATPPAKGGSKSASKKKPLVKKAKLVMAPDEEDNKYVARRRKSDKKPLIIGGVCLGVGLLIAFFMFQHSKKQQREHELKVEQAKQEREMSRRPADEKTETPPKSEPEPESKPESKPDPIEDQMNNDFPSEPDTPEDDDSVLFD